MFFTDDPYLQVKIFNTDNCANPKFTATLLFQNHLLLF